MSKRAAVLFVAIGLVWGIPYMLVRVAVEHLEPATLVFAGTAIGACVLLPVAAARGELGPERRRGRFNVRIWAEVG